MKKGFFLTLLLISITSLFIACTPKTDRGSSTLVLQYIGQNNIQNSASIDTFSDYFSCSLIYEDGSFDDVANYTLVCTSDETLDNPTVFDSHVIKDTRYYFRAKVGENYSENNPICITVAGLNNLILECNNDITPTGEGTESSSISAKKYFVYENEETTTYTSCFSTFDELKSHLNAYYKFADNTKKSITLIEGSSLVIDEEPNQLNPDIEKYSIKCVDSDNESNTIYVKNLPATYSVSLPSEIACYAGQKYEDVVSKIVINVSTTVNSEEIESGTLTYDDCFYAELNSQFVTSAHNLVKDKEYTLTIKFVYKDDIFRKTIKIKQYALAYEYIVTNDAISLNEQLNYTIYSMSEEIAKDYIYGVCCKDTSKSTYMYNVPCLGYSETGEDVKYSSDYGVYSKLSSSFRLSYCDVLQSYLKQLKEKGINATIQYLPSLSYMQGVYYTSRVLLTVDTLDNASTYNDLLFTKTANEGASIISSVDNSGEIELNKTILIDYSVFINNLK